MKTMRERIAELIEPNSWKALGKGLGDSLAHENRRTSSLRKADRILDELREPDEGMVRSGYSANTHLIAKDGGGLNYSFAPTPVWQAMIDHALQEGR